MTAPTVAKVVGRNEKTVRKWIRWYNRGGADRIKARPNKGRTAWLNSEQSQRIEAWLDTPSGQGGRWTGPLLKQKIAEEFKIDYTLDGVYYLLHRMMYCLKRPRPHHPKINKQAQEDFKKWVWTKDYRNSKEVSGTKAKDII